MLEGKSIIVTGGGGGIGRAAAMNFAASGARVMVVDWSADAGVETRDMVRAAGGDIEFAQVDVSDEAGVQAMVAATVEQFGRIDGAFNNAGIQMHLKLLPDLSFEEYEKVIKVNLHGVFFCMKHEIAAMRKTGGGAIVNTSSTGGQMAIPMSAEYAATKHGVIGLTRAGAAEARLTGVRVNAVLPSLIETQMIADLMASDDFAGSSESAAILDRHSIGRFGKPDDVARAAKWLLSSESAFINGVALPVDGGFTAR